MKADGRDSLVVAYERRDPPLPPSDPRLLPFAALVAIGIVLWVWLLAGITFVLADREAIGVVMIRIIPGGFGLACMLIGLRGLGVAAAADRGSSGDGRRQ